MRQAVLNDPRRALAEGSRAADLCVGRAGAAASIPSRVEVDAALAAQADV